VEVSQPVPLEVEVGADIALKVKVTCSSGCDPRGEPVKVMTPDGVVMTREQLASDAARNNETEEFALQAPKQGGEYTWSLVFPRHETENLIHEESSLAISFRTIPHKTSLAIWDVPSPVAMNNLFRAKIGIKCSARCQLAGQLVEVRDETGTKMGEGKLGETPWEGTDALYWGVAEITAPATEGVCFWTVTFTGAELAFAHEEASVNFSFRADKPPEHRVTIKVIGEDTRAPIRHAHVRLGFYIAETDEGGLATFELPEGSHHLKIWKDGYEGPPMSVEVAEDVTIQVEALKTLTEAEIDEKVLQLEASSWG
jgi:hypothetical protein